MSVYAYAPIIDIYKLFPMELLNLRLIRGNGGLLHKKTLAFIGWGDLSALNLVIGKGLPTPCSRTLEGKL